MMAFLCPLWIEFEAMDQRLRVSLEILLNHRITATEFKKDPLAFTTSLEK